MKGGITTVVRVYNKFLIDMVLNLKGANANLKKALKAAGHKAIDPMSDAYIEHALLSMPRETLVSVQAVLALEDAAIAAFEPLKGVPFEVIGDGASEDGKLTVLGYLFIFATLCATYAECKDGGEGNDALVANVLDVLSKVQATDADLNDALDGIMDDDIVGLLERFAEVSVAAAASRTTAPGGVGGEGGLGGGLDEVMKSLESSKIADLAKEISSEIDVSKLASAGSENPMDMLNFSNLADSNSVLGSIVSKVGTKIQNKLANGELKHEELLSEAMSLLKAFDTNSALADNPLLGNMLKAAKGAAGGGGGGGGLGGLGALFGGGNNNKDRSANSRERMRQKLAQRAASEAAAASSTKQQQH